MITVDTLDESHVVITSDFPMRDKELIMSLPGARYDAKEYRYIAPLTWATCRTLRGIFGDHLKVGESLNAWAWLERNTRVDPARAMREAFNIDDDDSENAKIVENWRNGHPKPMYPFQESGTVFLSFARRALLCDEMGTGKSRQAIETLKLLHAKGETVFPAIVVAPNNMTLTWQKEFNEWWPGLKINVIKGAANVRRKSIADPAHVYIINYEGLRAHSRLAPYGSVRLKKCVVCDSTLPDTKFNRQTSCEHCKKELNFKAWKSIIVDEAHRMKDPKAKQTRAVWALRTADTENVLCLTGTAIANAPHDLWPALHLISKDEFPSRNKYIDRFCDVRFNPFGGMTVVGLSPRHKDEFFDIVDPRMRRMPKKAVLPFLPDKNYMQRYVEMTKKQTDAYRQMENGLIAIIGDGADGSIAVAANPLVQLTRLTQFASAYAEIDMEGNVRLANPSNKVDGLMSLLDDMGDEPLVVFAQSRQLIELAIKAAEARDITYATIVGGQTVDEREHQKMLFQNGKKRVIFCTIAAGGIGITLTRANTACFLQRSWSMVDNAQAEDRVHRIGSEVHDTVNIVDIISIGTIEERQRIVLGSKLERLEEVMRDRDTIRRLLGV